MKSMTEQKVINLLHLRIAQHGGGQVAAAHAMGISAAYLCDILHGRRAPAVPVLAWLGLERVVDYRPMRRPV